MLHPLWRKRERRDVPGKCLFRRQANQSYRHQVEYPDGLFAETPAIPYDGGLNYHFKDLGNTTEVVTYQGEKCEDAVKFIFANKEKRIKVEYTGGKPYILYIADADKKAIASTYELAVVLSDIEKLTKEKEKATKKLVIWKRSFHVRNKNISKNY